MGRIQRKYTTKTRQLCALLGGEIRAARLQRRMTAASLAERAGVSTPTVLRVEKGEPACSIGLYLELASLVGIDVIGDRSEVDRRLADNRSRLALLPRRVGDPKPDDAY